MIRYIFAVSIALLALTACSPDVGSEEWCEDLKEKDKGEWTLNETAKYAKSCIL